MGIFFSHVTDQHITIQKHWQMHINEKKKRVENNRVYCLYQLNTPLTKLFADFYSEFQVRNQEVFANIMLFVMNK